MKEVNAEISKYENDNEDTSNYRRVEVDDFLMALVKDDSRFLLPSDEGGTRWMAIKIEDILRIYREHRDEDVG